ncbi:Bax inhibitor-1/YccA family protein [Oceanispirochaeta crateris]|uniref:Bax inhibitor-1/YccA family protein n=1 Tax=Oceanispirochaeta crateris TaxID=2518645 RepID=A0A5C1QJ13_9SPIO|nr:Bax inhibitor-1/YccA family protein [Oceanispirochaeta crateris]QEN07601.1 Bax inhibitor-1/YccA family protein [Oceanispirochaeta crateris]
MNQTFTGAGSRQTAQDRTILKNVYLWMTAGLFLTAIVARAFLVTGLYRIVFTNPILMFGLIIAQLVLVFRLSSKINTMTVGAAITTFGVYASLNGINMSSIFLMYNLGTITNAFVSTAALFGAMSIWAVTTKKDLSGWGHYLMMGLVGLIIASLINMFLRSSGMSYLISYVGVLLFTGLTAYDTQKIKNMSRSMSYSVDEGQFVKLSILGALILYLDFINMFLFILRLMGRRD